MSDSVRFPPSYFVCNPDQFGKRLRERAKYEHNQEVIKQRGQRRAQELEELRFSQLTDEQRQQELDQTFKTRLQEGFYGGLQWALSSGKYDHFHIWLDEDNTASEIRIAREFAKELVDIHGYQKAYVARDWEYDCMRNCVYVTDNYLHKKRKAESPDPDPVVENSSSSSEEVTAVKKARKR